MISYTRSSNTELVCSDLSEELLLQLERPLAVGAVVCCQVANVCALQHHLHPCRALLAIVSQTSVVSELRLPVGFLPLFSLMLKVVVYVTCREMQACVSCPV